MSASVVRRIAAVAALGLAVSLAACSDSSSSDRGAARAGSSTTSTSSVAPATAAADEHPCAWATRADKATQNIAYPDTAATYWGLTYRLAPGEHIELAGTLPAARYFSFITYRPAGGAIDTLTDRDLTLDDDARNPFAGKGGSVDGQRYTVMIGGDAADAAGNDLGAKPAGADADPTAMTLPADLAAKAGPDVIGTGKPGDVAGTLLYRVYVSDDAKDRTGGAGLPGVALVGADGKRHAIPTCPKPGPGALGPAIVERFGPATDRPAPSQPVFIRPQGASANLYPNPDNIYVATIVHHEPGRVVVVTGKAPTFPDPAHGRPIGSGEQVRYWSMCTNEYRKPYPVTACATDAETAVGSGGTYTYVISTPEDRPANATTANGVTWLPWGSTKVDGLLLMRHMLASPDFPESAVNLAPGELAIKTMGPYAPRGAYCTTAQFEADDPACRPS